MNKFFVILEFCASLVNSHYEESFEILEILEFWRAVEKR